MKKEEIRKIILALRSEQEPLLKEKNDKAIRSNLCEMQEFISCKEFLIYLSTKGEVSTDLIIEKYFSIKKIVVPKIRNDEIELYELRNHKSYTNGKYGIREPRECVKKENLEEMEIAIIPGVAFDNCGNRIGFGGGYFDKLLLNLKCITIGLAYEFQIVEQVPAQSHDVPVDFIVTEKRVIDCGFNRQSK